MDNAFGVEVKDLKNYPTLNGEEFRVIKIKNGELTYYGIVYNIYIS